MPVFANSLLYCRFRLIYEEIHLGHCHCKSWIPKMSQIFDILDPFYPVFVISLLYFTFSTLISRTNLPWTLSLSILDIQDFSLKVPFLVEFSSRPRSCKIPVTAPRPCRNIVQYFVFEKTQGQIFANSSLPLDTCQETGNLPITT